MYFASNDSNDVVASPAKIIIYDLNAGQVLQTFVFPPQVAPFNNSVRHVLGCLLCAFWWPSCEEV